MIVDANSCDSVELTETLWSSGHLRYKLQAHQHPMYDHYREWEERAEADEGMSLIYVLDCGRRVGKTFLSALIKTEDCLRRPGSIVTYATAYAKDIAEIIVPIMDDISADAPDAFRPRYMRSSQGMQEGYRFANGSIMRLVGIDMHPRALRGRRSDGFVISEAAHVKGLKHTVGAVIYPQFMRVPHARLILESSAPEDPNHDFDKVFVPDAKARKAYLFRTINDNSALTPEQRDKFVDAARMIDPDDAEREYFGKRVRNRTKVIVPEFEAPSQEQPHTAHVRPFERPEYAIAMVAMDPGMRDLFAVLWGFWDARRAKLCIERDWAARNTSTGAVAEMLKRVEIELYGPNAGTRAGFGVVRPEGLTYWDGREFRANPYMRVSDTEARLIGDLTVDYGISVQNTLKDDKEAALFALRNAFNQQKIEIHPRCVRTIEHLTSAKWNDQRTDYERTEEHGHYDLLDALVYLWRMIQPVRAQDPFPPKYVDRNDPRVLFHQPAPVSHQVRGLQQAFGGKRASWR